MTYVIDSYNESNYSSYIPLYSGSCIAAGQSFTNTKSSILDSCKWYLNRYGSPTGNAVAKIYAETHATAFGTDSIPTGSALATSDNFDVAALTADYQLILFNFSGANRIALTAETYYVVVIEYSGGDLYNRIHIAGDGTSPTHSGSYAYYDGDTWSSSAIVDRIFYVYGEGNIGTLLKYGLPYA